MSERDVLDKTIEAALFAYGEPLPLVTLATVCDGASDDAITAALQRLRTQYADSSLELVEVAGGYRLQVRADYASSLTPLWTRPPQKLSRATMETLAVIAYQQPVTRGDIETIRGITVRASTLRLLLDYEWIKPVGQRETPGRPTLFATTTQFLNDFGLHSLDDLPPLESFVEAVPAADADNSDGGDETDDSDGNGDTRDA